MSKAFQLGELEQSLIYLENISGDQTEAITKILSNATKILQSNSIISAQQLHDIAERILPTKHSPVTVTDSMAKTDSIFKFCVKFPQRFINQCIRDNCT